MVNAVVSPSRPKLQINDFVLEIPGLDCQVVQTVGEIVVRISADGTPAISRIVLTFPGNADLSAWMKWSDQLSAAGAGPDDNERPGLLQLRYRKTPTLTMDLQGLGVSRISPVKVIDEKNPNNYGKEVELYCEGIKIRETEPIVIGPPRGASATAEPVAPAPRKPVAPHGHKHPQGTGTSGDQGARDIEAIPRFKDSQRLSYAQSLTKLSNEEQAEYATKADPKQVEEFYAGAMKDAGWNVVWRKEAGKDAEWAIDLRWDRDKTVAKVVLSLMKDGRTKIELKLTAPVK